MNRSRSLFVVFAVGLFLVGAGCEPTSTAPPILEPLRVEWKDAGLGASVREVPVGSRSTKGLLKIFRFPADTFSWRFEHSTSAVSVREWADTFPSAALVTNGVYFHEDYSPSGAFVSKGRPVGDRAFDADKSGTIVLAPEVRLIDTERDPVSVTSFQEAAQTYPFLLKEGAEAVTEDSGKVAERTFIGTDTSGSIYLGTLTNEALSLYELMKLLDEQPIEWQNVLNLDGGPSTGYIADFPNENGSRNSLTPVPNVIVVEPR